MYASGRALHFRRLGGSGDELRFTNQIGSSGAAGIGRVKAASLIASTIVPCGIYTVSPPETAWFFLRVSDDSDTTPGAHARSVGILNLSLIEFYQLLTKVNIYE